MDIYVVCVCNYRIENNALFVTPLLLQLLFSIIVTITALLVYNGKSKFVTFFDNESNEFNNYFYHYFSNLRDYEFHEQTKTHKEH